SGKGLEVPLVIEDNSGQDREHWPARGGVPFAPGQLQPEDVSELAVVDRQGNQVPAQFDPFVLWWGRDGSVKWLLVDILTDVPAQGRAEYSLVRKEPAAEDRLRLEETQESITVHTGPLKAVISKTRGTVLEEVYLDRNQDGSFQEKERIIQPHAKNGSFLRSDSQEVVYGSSPEYNMWGYGGGRIGRDSYQTVGELKEHKYASGIQVPEQVSVESKGPVRASIRIQGRHMPGQEGEGIRQEGMYHYTVWLHFYAGRASIDIQHSLDNQRQEYPMHIYRIQEAGLQFALDNQDEARYVLGTENGKQQAGTLQESQVSILQDSASRERWDLYNRLQGKDQDEAKKTPGYFHRAKAKLGPAEFRGYKIVAEQAGDTSGKELDTGDHAPGYGGLDFGGHGVSLFLQRFWMECPKAMRFAPDRLQAVFFPGFSPEQFQVHSSARKSHDLTLSFHSGEEKLQQDLELGPAFLHPLHLRTKPKWYAQSRAYPRHIDVQGIQDPDDQHWYPHFRWDKDIITANWRTLGMQTGFNSGGMHANYWSLFHKYLREGGLQHWQKGRVKAKWASEWIPWLINDYSFSSENPLPQHRLVGWGPKELYTNKEATQIQGWVRPFTTNIPAFSAPAKSHLDGEHLVHMWPFEWYYLTGSPIARQGLLAVGNQAKYSAHRHMFKDVQEPAPSLETLFYYDDQQHPERVPKYFYTRIYASHLLSTAWSYAATGDESSLFYAKWLVRRILYLQRENAGTLGGEKSWDNIPPWQEAEAAMAAYALYRETGDKALLDIMGSWLEWAWQEAYEPGQGMPHRFQRGTDPEKFEHHWYPGVAAPLVYAALGDPKALQITREWAESSLPHIKKGKFLKHPAGQSAAYVLNHLLQEKHKTEPAARIDDLEADFDPEQGIVLSWTAPAGSAPEQGRDQARYWIKYSEQPIVDQPSFPEEMQDKVGFYHADNIQAEPPASSPGTKEEFVVRDVEPHGAYGAQKKLQVSDLDPGEYYFVIKTWDTAGNLSEISNLARVRVR
ncbi:MAG: hypothetical protein R6U22_00390, partial [Desulfohalobiaceae bacterium]